MRHGCARQCNAECLAGQRGAGSGWERRNSPDPARERSRCRLGIRASARVGRLKIVIPFGVTALVCSRCDSYCEGGSCSAPVAPPFSGTSETPSAEVRHEIRGIGRVRKPPAIPTHILTHTYGANAGRVSGVVLDLNRPETERPAHAEVAARKSADNGSAVSSGPSGSRLIRRT
jgi:hypothetical protein